MRGVRLPATYREFLRTMGRSSGRFVWERGYDHGFATITRRLPTDAYPARYFKIAQTTDDHVADDGTAVDYFLDLEHGDGVDAPLVTFEDPTLRDPDADPDYPGLRPAGRFASRFTRSWFRCVVLERQRCGETVEIASSSDRVVAVLKELGFVEVLPPLPDTRCLRRGAEDGALVELGSSAGRRARSPGRDRRLSSEGNDENADTASSSTSSPVLSAIAFWGGSLARRNGRSSSALGRGADVSRRAASLAVGWRSPRCRPSRARLRSAVRPSFVQAPTARQSP